MLENFVIVVHQIIILFLLILGGFLCGKCKLITSEGAGVCTNITLYLAVPCAIINSYIREFSFGLLKDLLVSMGLSALIHLIAIAIANVFYPIKDSSDRNRICHYATIFSNAGFMALPLQQAILGDIGVFFGASYVAVFNIISWTYGVFCMNGSEKRSFSIRKLINPGTLSVAIGIIIFAFSVPVHKDIHTAISHFANLNTPLPMIIIGYYLGKSKLSKALKRLSVYKLSLIRLILVPVISLLIIRYVFNISSNMLVSMIIAVSAPVAANTTMFAVMFGRDEEYSVSLVSFTTLASIFTMPVIVAVTRLL